MAAHRNAKVPKIDLCELRTIAELQQQLAQVFPSIGSLQWELRTNRTQYVRGGALFEISGSLMAHPETFKSIALELAARRAAK